MNLLVVQFLHIGIETWAHESHMLGEPGQHGVKLSDWSPQDVRSWGNPCRHTRRHNILSTPRACESGGRERQNFKIRSSTC